MYGLQVSIARDQRKAKEDKWKEYEGSHAEVLWDEDREREKKKEKGGLMKKVYWRGMEIVHSGSFHFIFVSTTQFLQWG